MNFSGKTVLVYIEEDNTQRAYFRIRPLLTSDGPVDKDVLAQYPDDGYLRIVPDKNEQHTFKERMRTLGSICMLDLSQINPETLKIRNNKNYSPAKGERNQFIVYSDAIKALPEDLFYQVVPEDQVTSALTPKAYSRSGARIQGPYDAKDGSSAETLSVLPPDSAQIFNVTLPDGKELLIYCAKPQGMESRTEDNTAMPAEEETAAPAEETVPNPEAEDAPAANDAADTEISQMQHRLNEIFHAKARTENENAPEGARQDAESAKNAKKAGRARKGEAEDKAAAPAQDNAIRRIMELNGSLKVQTSLKEETGISPMQPAETHSIGGTKLYKPTMERRMIQKAKNSLAETVDQMRVSRFESRGEAPGAQISDTTKLEPVVNPLEQFRHALRRVWMVQETHRQVVDMILATSGMRPMLSRVAANGTNDLTVRAMNSQLQELEAERLMTLMQLDDVKKSRQKLLDTVLQDVINSHQKQLASLEKEISTRKAQAEEMKETEKQMLTDAEKQKQAMEALSFQAVLTKQPGEAASADEIINRMCTSLTRAGFAVQYDDVAALLVLLLQAEENCVLEINADTVPDAKTAVKAIAASLGAPFAEISTASVNAHPVQLIPSGDSAAFTFDTGLAPLRLKGLTHVIGMEADDTLLGRLKDELLLQYTNAPWPVWWIKTVQDAMPAEIEPMAPVSMPALKEAVLKPYDGTMDESAKQLLNKTRAILKDTGAPMPLETVKKIAVFVTSAKDLLRGGIARALDYCFMAYIVPHIRFSGIDPAVIRDLTAGMPMTYLELSKA